MKLCVKQARMEVKSIYFIKRLDSFILFDCSCCRQKREMKRIEEKRKKKKSIWELASLSWLASFHECLERLKFDLN